MDQRIDLLEREMNAIKSEVARIKSACLTREDIPILEARFARVDEHIAALRHVAAEMNVKLTRVDAQIAHLATKVELKDLDSRLKGWMITHTIVTISLLSSIQFALYTALKQ